MKKPVVLMILDGWGLAPNQKGNAIFEAKTPNIDNLLEKYPHSYLKASGLSVGLPEGIMGNSEVGHLNIGAGRVVYQDLTRINKSIEDKSFFTNKVLLNAFSKLKEDKALHVMGLCSDAGVHSDIKHLKALLKLAKEKKVKNVVLHLFMDGRDTDPNDGMAYLKDIETFLKENQIGRIGTISGRYYAMDRDTRWDRVEKTYSAMVLAEPLVDLSPLEYLKKSYEQGFTDEFVYPVSFSSADKIQDEDLVVFYNFRSDRAREITRAINEKGFDGFKRSFVPKLKDFVCFTEYDEKFKHPIAFPKEKMTNVFGEIVANKGLKQLRIAETEKYAHVTFFFNGGEEKQFSNENRILVDSPRDVATYDLKPEMSAKKVTKELLKVLSDYDFIVINYANCDMVGHTGDFLATLKAVETVDVEAGKIIDSVLNIGGSIFITADHGNAEKMLDEEGRKHTAHTTNLVNLIFVSNDKNICLKDGKLSDIVPSILDYSKIEKPTEMTGESLLFRGGEDGGRNE